MAKPEQPEDNDEDEGDEDESPKPFGESKKKVRSL
jgi:hypothetical protein